MGRRLTLVISLLWVTTATSCVGYRIDSAISKYETSAPAVQLGDSLARVRSVLDSTQESLPDDARKAPEAFLKDGRRVDILYYRSRRQADDLTTAYVFEDQKLVGIGWTAIGGPKTQGQAVPRTNVNVHVEQPKTP
jgi:hypothetical protein